MGDKDHASTPSPSSGAACACSPPPVRGKGMTLQKCQAIIDKSLHKNPKVRILVESMEKSGCSIGTNFIRAVRCGKPHSGGFMRGRGIVICANYANYKDEVVQTVIHELIHAYDECRAANLRWGNSTHQACSEIRANHLSGDCHLMREYLRGHLHRNGLKIKGHEPVCVKRRSGQSVGVNHSPAATKIAIESVWDICYNDTAPFDRVP